MVESPGKPLEPFHTDAEQLELAYRTEMRELQRRFESAVDKAETLIRKGDQASLLIRRLVHGDIAQHPRAVDVVREKIEITNAEELRVQRDLIVARAEEVMLEVSKPVLKAGEPAVRQLPRRQRKPAATAKPVPPAIQDDLELLERPLVTRARSVSSPLGLGAIGGLERLQQLARDGVTVEG